MGKNIPGKTNLKYRAERKDPQPWEKEYSFGYTQSPEEGSRQFDPKQGKNRAKMYVKVNELDH